LVDVIATVEISQTLRLIMKRLSISM
jgi:hypothetical protein